MVNNQFNIPRSFTVGDSFTWEDRDLFTIDPSTQSPFAIDPASWNLVFFIRGQTEITVSGTPWSSDPLNVGSDRWVTSIPSGISSLLVAGKYWCQVVVYKPGYQLSLAVLELIVLPSLQNLVTYDGRSPQEIELDLVNAAIASVLKDGVAEYEIKGRKATFLDLNQLRELRKELNWKIATHNRRGLNRNVKIRFT